MCDAEKYYQFYSQKRLAADGQGVIPVLLQAFSSENNDYPLG